MKRLKYLISFLTAISGLKYKHLPFSSLPSLKELNNYSKVQGKTALRKVIFIFTSSYSMQYATALQVKAAGNVQIQATESSSKNSSITTLSILYAYSGFSSSSTVGNK